MSADGPLRTALGGGVLSLTLDRPAKRNALNRALIDALHAAFERADLDTEVRVVVLRGAGVDFCAGADLADLLASSDRSFTDNEAEASRLGALFERMRRMPKPVIGVVQGRALAGGAGLATACDLVVAASSARLGYPEVARGFVPAVVMVMLRRLCGEALARDLVLTGRLLSAEEARMAGLLSRVVADSDLEREATALASQLAAAPPSAVALTKRLFHELDHIAFSEGVALAARANALARHTPEFRSAIAQFLEK
jgi:methylglutaconyl-CoA hydratase